MLASYLSDHVKQVLFEFGKTCNICTKTFLTEELTYNWNEIKRVLGGITDDFEILDQSEAWYLEKSQLLWNVIHEAGSAVSTAPIEERETLYQLCDWADCHLDLVDYAFNCQNKDEDGPLLAILVLTAGLERALGNVYITKNHPVPFLLRDLLKTPELLNTFGKVPTVFTQFLVGCPRGFNIRNVAWHGFLSPGEIHPHIVSALVILIASLGKELQGYKITKRPLLSSYESYQELADVFPDISERFDEIQNIIEKSLFVPEKHKILWKKANYLFQSERYGYSLVLLLPQLEHCLRVLYCRVNDCPRRLLTAESTVLYTTLDEILAPCQNAVVSDGLLMLLLDMTSSLSGPRVRDRLSHGEIELSSVPRWLINFVFCVALATAHSVCGNCNDGKNCNISLCSLLQEASACYQSRFHVLASLRCQLESLLDRWPCWQHCSQPADVVVQPASCQLIKDLDQLMFPDGGGVLQKLLRIKDCIKHRQLSTLYRPKSELELATALSVTVSRVSQTAEKVYQAAESRYNLWLDRQLRSRSRETALRMWSALPDIWSGLLCTLMVVALCYRQLPRLATLGKNMTRFVKSLKKAVENTVSLCDVEKNRWVEAHQILSNLASICLQFFTDNVDIVKITK